MKITASIVACALTLVLLAGAVSAIPSSQVVNIISPDTGGGGYLNSGEAAQLLLNQPVDYQGEGYWLVYSYVISQPGTRNVIFSISDNTGNIVSDPTVLTPLFTFVYQNDLMNSLTTDKESLEDFQNFLSGAQSTEQQTSANYYQLISNQLAQQYPNIDFSTIGISLTKLETAQTNANNQILSNEAILNQYDSYPNIDDFNTYYTQFNTTLNSLQTLSNAVDQYHNALFLETQTVSNSANLNYSDKSTITSALENLQNVGDYADFKTSVLAPSQAQYNSLAIQIPNEVNESVESSIYRIAQKDAENAFTTAFQNQVQSALSTSSLQEYTTCSIDVSDLKTQWAHATNIMTNTANQTPALLETVPTIVTNAENDLTTIQNSLSTCQQNIQAKNAAAQAQPPQQNNGWLVNILILLLVILLAYIGYSKWKKMQEEKQE